MIEEAQHHFESGNFPAAEALYRKMLDDEPDNPEVLFMLALVRQTGPACHTNRRSCFYTAVREGDEIELMSPMT